MSNMASALIGINGERVALADVAVSATLKDLLTEVTVSHTYHNQENENIEPFIPSRSRWTLCCWSWKLKLPARC